MVSQKRQLTGRPNRINKTEKLKSGAKGIIEKRGEMIGCQVTATTCSATC